MAREAIELTLRSAVPDDHDWIIRSVDDWWGRPVSHALPRLFLDHFHATSFVMEHGEDAVAFLVGFLSPSAPEVAYIHFVGVHPSYRSLGIARRLYRSFFELATQADRSVVKAITASVNTPSIAFHERMGFRVSEPIEDYDRPGGSHVVFQRDL